MVSIGDNIDSGKVWDELEEYARNLERLPMPHVSREKFQDMVHEARQLMSESIADAEQQRRQAIESGAKDYELTVGGQETLFALLQYAVKRELFLCSLTEKSLMCPEDYIRAVEYEAAMSSRLMRYMCLLSSGELRRTLDRASELHS